jgi:dihydropteroate synthase
MLALPGAGAEHCLVMGVVNVTPDSFSDGGKWFTTEAAVARGHELVAQGADLLDVGGESTRPGAARVPAEEELRRVLPVIRELAAAGVPVSVDTTRAAVADAALEAGAVLVNDVSGGRADARMPSLVAAAGVPFVAMHWRGHSQVMETLTTYSDVVTDVLEELARGVDRLVAAGVDADRVVVDPGLGFAKTAAHNWQLLAALDRIVALGPPVLLGASRKRFLGALLAADDGTPAPVTERDAASHAVTTIAATAGVWCVRVHEVRASADAVRVVAAVKAAAHPTGPATQTRPAEPAEPAEPAQQAEPAQPAQQAEQAERIEQAQQGDPAPTGGTPR